MIQIVNSLFVSNEVQLSHSFYAKDELVIILLFIKFYYSFFADTTPPRHILNPDARLIDENLVPSAIIYYSGQSSLKSSVKAKLTDPRAAGIEAVKSR